MTTLRTRPQSPGTPTLAPVPPAPPPSVEKPARLASLDAYRGFIMVTLASGGLALGTVWKQSFPDDPLWTWLAFQTDHVAWLGCSFWDLIQPSFMFMVGVAMPFSYAARKAHGDSELRIGLHALGRSIILILLGIFLRSKYSTQTNFTFEDVVTQIGLGYCFVFLLLGRGLNVQLAALAAVLVGYWAVFALYPLPGPNFDFAAVGVPDGPWLTDFFQHWDKNTNAAHWFEVWFLNLFPRPQPFAFNPGGYLTLNFIPSMGTMLIGLMAGELLRGPRSRSAKFGLLVVSAAVCLGLGLLANATVCPIVKRIWTPSWTLYSGGIVLAILAGFYLVVDVWGWKAWTFPLAVVGMNSIVIYCMIGLLPGWIIATLKIHFGTHWAEGTYGPIWQRLAALAVMWLICFWMYRRKIFVRI